eukprot:3741947-Pyramimonas_sp.AAC.2
MNKRGLSSCIGGSPLIKEGGILQMCRLRLGAGYPAPSCAGRRPSGAGGSGSRLPAASACAS